MIVLFTKFTSMITRWTILAIWTIFPALVQYEDYFFVVQKVSVIASIADIPDLWYLLRWSFFCCTNAKRNCSLLEDASMKLIEILGINVKLIDKVEYFSFFRWINEKNLQANCHQKPALRKFTTITYPLHWCKKSNVPEVLNVHVNENNKRKSHFFLRIFFTTFKKKNVILLNTF